MSYRRKEGLFDLLLDSPWWVSIVFASIVYLGVRYGLPWYAQENRILSGIAKGVSPVAAYFAVPFLLVSVVTFIRSCARRALLKRQTDSESIRSLSWQEFELLCGEAFRQRGYVVTENGLGGADGGIDLILRKDRQTHLVQCKRWKKAKVGVKDVRELFGIVKAQQADSGIFISTGHFTQDARAFADDKPIDLINGREVLELIGRARSGKQGLPPGRKSSPKKGPQNASAPDCPRCGNRMQIRTARRGKHEGKRFWGCTNFPECREIVNMN